MGIQRPKSLLYLTFPSFFFFVFFFFNKTEIKPSLLSVYVAHPSRSRLYSLCDTLQISIHDVILQGANMATSKLEINFRRLLERCEAMAEEIQDNKENVNWRLDRVSIKY